MPGIGKKPPGLVDAIGNSSFLNTQNYLSRPIASQPIPSLPGSQPALGMYPNLGFAGPFAAQGHPLSAHLGQVHQELNINDAFQQTQYHQPSVPVGQITDVTVVNQRANTLNNT